MKVLKFAAGAIAAIFLIKMALSLLKVVVGLAYIALVVGIVAFIVYFVYRLVAGEQKGTA
jgi:hypothetical protein